MAIPPPAFSRCIRRGLRWNQPRSVPAAQIHRVSMRTWATPPALRDAAASGEEGVRLHAEATRRLADDPDLGFAAALDEATKASILGS